MRSITTAKSVSASVNTLQGNTCETETSLLAFSYWQSRISTVDNCISLTNCALFDQAQNMAHC